MAAYAPRVALSLRLLVPTTLVPMTRVLALVLANVDQHEFSFLDQPPVQLLLACPVQKVLVMVPPKRRQPQVLQQAHQRIVRPQLRQCYCHAAAA